MSDQPWEGRTVWCSGADDSGKTDCGWIEARERNAGGIEIVMRKPGVSAHLIEMSRAEAKTFAAHLMNLAGRDR